MIRSLSLLFVVAVLAAGCDDDAVDAGAGPGDGGLVGDAVSGEWRATWVLDTLFDGQSASNMAGMENSTMVLAAD